MSNYRYRPYIVHYLRFMGGYCAELVNHAYKHPSVRGYGMTPRLAYQQLLIQLRLH